MGQLCLITTEQDGACGIATIEAKAAQQQVADPLLCFSSQWNAKHAYWIPAPHSLVQLQVDLLVHAQVDKLSTLPININIGNSYESVCVIWCYLHMAPL